VRLIPAFNLLSICFSSWHHLLSWFPLPFKCPQLLNLFLKSRCFSELEYLIFEHGLWPLIYVLVSSTLLQQNT
jgi:hypothetical protein